MPLMALVYICILLLISAFISSPWNINIADKDIILIDTHIIEGYLTLTQSNTMNNIGMIPNNPSNKAYVI